MNFLQKLKSFFKPTLADISRKSEKRHLEYIKSISPTIGIQKVFTSPTTGVNWYMLSKPLDMREERSALLDEALEIVRWNLTVDDAGKRFMEFPDKFKMLISLMKDGQSDAAIRRCQDLLKSCLDYNHRLRELSSVDAIMSIASIYFYIDGEDPSVVNPEFQLIKKQILRDDPAVRAFFLKNTVDTFKISTNVNNEDFTNFLKTKMMKGKTRHLSDTTNKQLKKV